MAGSACRACLGRALEPLRARTAALYNALTGLQVSVDDGLPQKLCNRCMANIEALSSFREKCIKSETILQSGLDFFENSVEIDVNIMKTDPDETAMVYDFPTKLENISDNDEWHNDYSQINVDITGTKVNMVNEASLSKKQCSFSCGLCKYTSETKEMLARHLDTHKTDESCSICKESFEDWPQLVTHRYKHLLNEKQLKYKDCYLCNKKFRSCKYLELHIRLEHCGGSGIKCNVCMKTYLTARQLTKHLSRSHGDRIKAKTFKCNVCHKMFISARTLSIHSVAHLQEKNFICDICDFRCKAKQNIQNHIQRVHTFQKSPCDLCGKILNSTLALREHKYQIHADEKMCPICGLMLRGKSVYNHKSVHRGIKHECSICHKKYTTKKILKMHMDAHKNIKTHQCDHCDASFSWAASLLKHRRIHTGEKPYVCHICQRGFTGGHNLKVHMRVHGKYLVTKKIPVIGDGDPNINFGTNYFK